MGFLTGAYLKMHSTRMRLQLQNELTRIVSQMNRVTKQIGQVERMMTAQQRNCNMAIQAQMQTAAMRAANRAGINFNNMNSIFTTNSPEAQKQMAAMQQYSGVQQQIQYMGAQAQSTWADYFDMMREAQLEPLKDLEIELGQRKANIESRLKLIEGQEDAAKQMEKSSSKDFVPEYTGQG